MEIFYLTLSQMLMLFTFILIGFTLRKAKILPEVSVTTMSRLETFVFVPALTLSNWMENCTVTTLKENYVYILYGLVIVLASLIVAYPLSKLFLKNYTESLELDYKRNIYKYALTFGNYGFVGNFFVLGVWGSKENFTYTLISFGSPLGLNTIVYPGSFGGETKTGASMVMISHSLSVITIPMMYLIFIVWM